MGSSRGYLSSQVSKPKFGMPAFDTGEEGVDAFEIFRFVLRVEWFGKNDGFVLIVEAGQHDRDSRGLGHVPEAGLERVDTLSGSFRGDGEDEPLALSAGFGYLFDGIGFLRTVDGHSADPAHEGSEDAAEELLLTEKLRAAYGHHRSGCHADNDVPVARMRRHGDHALLQLLRKRPHELPPKHPEPYFPE